MNIILSIPNHNKTSTATTFTYETPNVGLLRYNYACPGILQTQPTQLIESLFFTEKKKNNIIDGIFTKILYSNPYFTMTGLYIHFQLCSKFLADTVFSFDGKPSMEIHRSTHTYRSGVARLSGEDLPLKDTVADLSLHKTYIQFDPYNEQNHFNIESLCKIETDILHIYSKMQVVPHAKTPVYGLKTQLYSGCIRAHAEYATGFTNEEEHNIQPKFTKYIKISGVWETDQAYGITYKVFME